MSNHHLTLPMPVLILEDDTVMQVRLKNMLFELGYQEDMLIFANNLKQAFDILEQQPISLALVDLGLPDGKGTQFIEHLRQQDPTSLIMVISAWATQEAILHAIKAGATGYILKERDDFEISLSMSSLLRGGAPIDPFIAQHILTQMIEIPQKSEQQVTQQQILSTRELEILQWVAQGLSNKEIADKTHISRYTVECHIKHIYRKLSVSNRSKAVNTARDIGLIS